MDITLHRITVRELVDGYENNDEDGVVGYGGRLNIRPKYQREFVYNSVQQEEVIQSIFKHFPLNVMYWVKNDDGTFELLDGQQRTLSICAFAEGDTSITLGGNPKFFSSLTSDQRAAFLDYELQIYICENGTDSEKLDWFRIINIAGERLTQQELRNAVYSGPWTMSAKRYFAKNMCVAYKVGQDYMTGTPIRQDYLETALRWMADADDMSGKDAIEQYMSRHKDDDNADREWQYFQDVISWVRSRFTVKRKEMKSVQWGLLYNRYKEADVTATALEQRINELMMDDNVTKKSGIYEYVLSADERCLHIRAFSDAMKSAAYARQKGICPKCGKHFKIEEMQGDHITPWSKGGSTTADNCQMLCADCNRRKSGV